jgi:hypothetical protein
MQSSERQELLALLSAGRQALVDALDGVTEEEAARVPAPGRWSVLVCVEHVALVEDYLFARLAEGRRVDATGIDPVREKLIRARAARRTRKVPAPEAVVPVGKYTTVAEAMAAFAAARERTVRYVEDCCEDLRAQLTTHPLLGPTNCYETLLMIALHPARHAEQIRETRASGAGQEEAYPTGA